MAHWVKIRKTLYTKKSTFYWKFLGTKWPVSNWTQLRNEDTNIFKMFIFCTIFLFFYQLLCMMAMYICVVKYIQKNIYEVFNLYNFLELMIRKICKNAKCIRQFSKNRDEIAYQRQSLTWKKNHTQVIGHTSYFFSPCDATGTQNWIFMCTV